MRSASGCGYPVRFRTFDGMTARIKSVLLTDFDEIRELPTQLIREVIDNKAYPYRGWRAVVAQEKKIEDIMGSSGLQSYILQLLEIFLVRNLNLKEYRFFGNESGNNLEKHTNFAFDKAIYRRRDVPRKEIKPKYINVPPVVVFEVDVDVDPLEESEIEYVHRKIARLLEYGVERVIWIFSGEVRRIIFAEPDREWRTVDWDTDLPIVNDLMLNLREAEIEDERLD